MSGGDIWQEPYPLDAQQATLKWKRENQPDAEERHRVDEFLWSLTDNTEPEGTFSAQGSRPLIHSIIAPGTDTQVTWVVVDSPPFLYENRRVRIVHIKRAPVD